jgi:hypothetical protein
MRCRNSVLVEYPANIPEPRSADLASRTKSVEFGVI